MRMFCNPSPFFQSLAQCSPFVLLQCNVNITQPPILKKKKKAALYGEYQAHIKLCNSTFWHNIYGTDRLPTVLSVVIKEEGLCAVSKAPLGGQVSPSWRQFYSPSVPCFSAGKVPHIPLQCKYKYTFNHHLSLHLG